MRLFSESSVSKSLIVLIAIISLPVIRIAALVYVFYKVFNIVIIIIFYFSWRCCKEARQLEKFERGNNMA